MSLKSNGFSRGPNCYQLVTIIFIALKILSFQYILSFLKLGIQIFFAISYSLSTACLIFSVFMMTYIDPTDDILKIQRKAKENNQATDDLKYEMYCEVCQASVSDNAKHCCACQRCVNDFDHHCHWVNNCISKKNYKYFIGSISSLFFSVLLFELASILFLTGYYQEKMNIINDLKSLKDDHSTPVLVILILIFTIIAGIVWILNARLILFHYYLYKNKMTTYGFITKFPERRKGKSSSITPDPLTTKTDASLTIIPDHLLTKPKKIVLNQQQAVASPKMKKEVLETNRSSSTAEDNTPKRSHEKPEKPSFSLFHEYAKKSDKVEKKRKEKKSFFKRIKEDEKDKSDSDVASSNIGSEFMSGSIFRVSPISSHNIYCEKFESDITLHNIKLQQIQKPDLSNSLFKNIFLKGEGQESRLAHILHNYSPKVGEITEEDNENESVRG